MTEKRRLWWERKREDGFWRFVMEDGIFGWGAGTACLVLLLEDWDGTLAAGSHVATRTILSFMLFGGIGWSACVWAWYERAYREHGDAVPPGT